jgi:hypothetical protein
VAEHRHLPALVEPWYPTQQARRRQARHHVRSSPFTVRSDLTDIPTIIVVTPTTATSPPRRSPAACRALRPGAGTAAPCSGSTRTAGPRSPRPCVASAGPSAVTRPRLPPPRAPLRPQLRQAARDAAVSRRGCRTLRTRVDRRCRTMEGCGLRSGGRRLRCLEVRQACGLIAAHAELDHVLRVAAHQVYSYLLYIYHIYLCDRMLSCL